MQQDLTSLVRDPAFAGLGRFGFNWTGSGADFSADDGAWGCGLGTVDGAGDMPEDFQANCETIGETRKRAQCC